MRIMLFSHGYPPTLSGVTLVVQKIARAMVERGHTVTVVTASEKSLPYRSEDRGVMLERILGIPNPFWWEGPMPFISTWKIRKLADQFKPDIIHSHDNAYQGIVLPMVSWDASQRLTTSCYTLPSFFTQFTRLFRLESSTESMMWKYYLSNLNRYEHVVFCTKTHERDFKAHGLTPPTTVISNGVNIQRYNPEMQPAEDIIQRYHLPPAPRILSVGRLMKDKRLDLLINAMRVVCDKMDAHLMVVGRGSERRKLKSLIHQLQLEPYIHLLGYVPEEDLPALYRASNLFTIPSMVEVQSIPALQAAVTGLPIVAANSAALPELVLNGENGYLVNPLDAHELGNAILSILSQPDLARKMSKVSLEIGLCHDEQLTFQKYEAFYQGLLKNLPEAPS
jgi:glycosyltransferase involved in cell wall biosynthesis